jgi:hypothetical protein
VQVFFAIHKHEIFDRAAAGRKKLNTSQKRGILTAVAGCLGARIDYTRTCFEGTAALTLAALR